MKTLALILGLLTITSIFAGDEIIQRSFKYGAQNHNDILDDRATELWGEITYPSDLGQDKEKLPIIFFLSGNHSTCGTGFDPRVDDSCTYTMTGRCESENINRSSVPSPYRAAPSHEGFRYLGDRFAAAGSFTISINANRGINCGSAAANDDGLILARGRMILKHLELLSHWDKGLTRDTPQEFKHIQVAVTPTEQNTPNQAPRLKLQDINSLKNKLDFNRVIIIGHSRGGEGARAAYYLYKFASSFWKRKILRPINFQGIFEIAPVDGQSDIQLNPEGVKWGVILPTCDGDVRFLEGIKPFDRIIEQGEYQSASKQTWLLWGGNHNFFNTQWQQSESPGCSDHPALFNYQDTASRPMQKMASKIIGNFVGEVLEQREEERSYANPLNPLDPSLTDISRVNRGYTLGSDSLTRFKLTNFSNNDVKNINASNGVLYQRGQAVYEHDPSVQAVVVKWRPQVTPQYLDISFMDQNSIKAKNLNDFQQIQMRVSKNYDPLLNFETFANYFALQLIGRDDNGQQKLSSTVYSRSFKDPLYNTPIGPLGIPGHPILESLIIPLEEFKNIDLEEIEGIRISFQPMVSGNINISGLEALRDNSQQRSLAFSGGNSYTFKPSKNDLNPPGNISNMANDGAIRKVLNQELKNNNFEITLENSKGIMVGGSLPIIWVGDVSSTKAEYIREEGRQTKIKFKLSADQYQILRNGDPIKLEYGSKSHSSGKRKLKFYGHLAK